MWKRALPLLVLGTLAAAPSLAGCSCSPDSPGTSDGFRWGDDDGSASQDLAASRGADLLLEPQVDLGLNACGDKEPSCTTTGLGPSNNKTFPLRSDPQPDPEASDDGVNRDANGWLVLDANHSNFDFLWIADDQDYGVGMVSKINTKTLKEVARYLTYTCFSDPVNGSIAPCDGTKGCCSRDDYAGYKNRKNMMAAGPHQPATRNPPGDAKTLTNRPSRTAVDFSGDTWIANRAFGLQPSVTKIAHRNNAINDTACIDRNKNGKIDTAADLDGNGLITVDCNADGLPDAGATLCAGGKMHEFFGEDDECILFTTNTGEKDSYGRPLTLGPGVLDFGPSDAWAGTFQDGRFFRIDGQTGMIKVDVKQNPCTVDNAAPYPYGAVMDKYGILWAPNETDMHLFYFDSANPQNQGCVVPPKPLWDTQGYNYGVTLDPDSNIWTGGWGYPHAYRYSPDRIGGFANLAKGKWLRVTVDAAMGHGQGRGIAADNRKAPGFFVWLAVDGAPGGIARIDTSKILMADTDIHLGEFYTFAGTSGTLGAGVAADGNIWGINQGSSNATRLIVNAAGVVQNPNPLAADTVSLDENPNLTHPFPYTYSDFTGFGLRTFTNPKGSYTYTFKGCASGKTKFMKLAWDAEVPNGTSILVKARGSDNKKVWGAWTQPYSTSPGNLLDPQNKLVPDPTNFLQVEIDFATTLKGLTPALKGLAVVWECAGMIG